MKNSIIQKYKEEGLLVPGVFDKAFKSIMQEKNCKCYLVDIINELTKLPKEYVDKNLIFKNSELPVKYLEEKQKITDLVVEIENTIINIEMNNSYYKGLIERNEIYLNELRKIGVGEKYIDIPKVIQINIDNFNKFKGETIRKFMILDVKNYEKETENYEKYHINLKKIKEKYYNKEKLTRIEKLLLLLVIDKKEELRKIAGDDEVMKKVEEKITMLSEDSAMILCYDEEEHKEKVRQAVSATEKEEAREEGLKEGIKEGIKEGEKTSKCNIAINMLKENIDINIISKVTNLSIEKINELNKSKQG